MSRLYRSNKKIDWNLLKTIRLAENMADISVRPFQMNAPSPSRPASLLLAFAIWMMFSAVTVNLPQIGFSFTADQLFWLAALPG